MNDPHLQSLLYPFSLGVSLEPGARMLCIGLGSAPLRLLELTKDLTFVQGFRPDYLALQRAGCHVVPEMPEQGFDAALVRLGRHRGQNEQWLADALRRLPGGSVLIAAGGRTDGSSSLRKRLAAIVPDLAHRAMNHGEVFWFRVPEHAAALAEQLQAPALEPVEGRFRTAPGMFSAGKIDAGSRLLAMHLPTDLGAEVADFAAGWGYLSVEVAARCPGVKTLHLYEADHASLEAARMNLPGRDDVQTAFFWHDLVGEAVPHRYDAIISNPPFHTGRRADPDLGQEILARAASALKPRGRLILVANRQLPYETVLARHFSRQRQILVADGYKVLEARK